MLAEAIVLIPKSENKGTEIQMDVLPLVLCKDCKHGARLERTGMTPLVTCKGEDHELDWFCADGESGSCNE